MPLIVFEGIDGCGKTTQQQRLIRRLRDAGCTVATWREPGGTPLGERLRELLLDPTTEACPIAEVFGYQMARAQLVHDNLKPALRRGEWVVLDRFYYSTIAYQAYGLGLDTALVQHLIEAALDGVRVDKCFWLSIDPSLAARRRSTIDDRIESRGLLYQKKVHEGYLAQSGAREWVTLEAETSVEELEAAIWQACQVLLRRSSWS